MGIPDIKFCVVTISDSCSQGIRQDKSGPALEELLAKSNNYKALISRRLIADEKALIEETLEEWSQSVDVILTTGGTGLSPRDNTPEATKSVLERECPGIVVALLQRSLKATPLAALSRLCAGTRATTLIVNLPGSVRAVKECFEVLDPLFVHSTEIMNGVEGTHRARKDSSFGLIF